MGKNIQLIIHGGIDVKQVKILHCGDIHLGAELTTLGRKAVTRRAEIKRVNYIIALNKINKIYICDARSTI
jgi:hypothetical protein